MISKQTDGKFTVCNAAGFLCVNASRDDAVAKLISVGYSPAEAASILDTPPATAVWHKTFIAASKAASVDVAAIREMLTTPSGELPELEQQLEVAAQQYRDVLTARGMGITQFTEDFIWKSLWETPAGIRLQELRAA